LIDVAGAVNVTVGSITDTALTTINASGMTAGTLQLGSATPSGGVLTVTPLTQNIALTMSGGANTSILNFNGSGVDTILGGNNGDTIVASGAGTSITDGIGANTITAAGAGDTIVIGKLQAAAVSAGTIIGGAIAGADVIQAIGAHDVVTFASVSTDGAATVIASTGVDIVEGTSGLVGIGANSTVNFGNTTAGSETVVLTGDTVGAGGSSATYNFTTLSMYLNTANALDKLIFNNATTEVTAGATLGASQVNVSTATTLAKALDLQRRRMQCRNNLAHQEHWLAYQPQYWCG